LVQTQDNKIAFAKAIASVDSRAKPRREVIRCTIADPLIING